MTYKSKPLTKEEFEFLISLVRSLKSELVSSEAVGMRVPKSEQTKVTEMEKRLEFQLACLSS